MKDKMDAIYKAAGYISGELMQAQLAACDNRNPWKVVALNKLDMQLAKLLRAIEQEMKPNE